MILKILVGLFMSGIVIFGTVGSKQLKPNTKEILDRVDWKTFAQHTKDPTKCKKVCAPAGYDGEFPEEFPEGVETVECAGDYCAKAGKHGHGEGEWGEQPGDDEEDCKPHFSCSVHCSEVCCICLRECI